MLNKIGTSSGLVKKLKPLSKPGIYKALGCPNGPRCKNVIQGKLHGALFSIYAKVIAALIGAAKDHYIKQMIKYGISQSHAELNWVYHLKRFVDMSIPAGGCV